jgi:YfiH family protein
VSLVWLTPDWPVPGRVHALSTQRTGGVSAARYASLNLGAHVGDEPAQVAENRRRLVAGAGLPAEPQWLTQVHGTRVLDLDQDDPGREADACVTRRIGTVCAILTADCLPVLLAAQDGSIVGAAHAGWRGLAAGVLASAVAALGVHPGSLLAWLGPAIGPQHFEVGGEVRDAFLAEDPAAADDFTVNQRNRYMADLPALARRRLNALGITQIYGMPPCTHADRERYFSHRRDGATGRHATLIWLENA